MRHPRYRTANGDFAIYRNNVAMGSFSALSARYPVVKRLVGDEFFRELSRRYIATEPPRSPIMLYYGETFPDFIDEFEPARPVPYLAAIARIEMARGLAYHAADAMPIGASDFAALPPRQLAELRLTLHPSVSVVTSPYPIYSIWNVNQSRAPVVPVSPWATEAALIARPVHTVEVTKLRTGEAVFLQTLAQGDTMAEAFELSTRRHTQLRRGAGSRAVDQGAHRHRLRPSHTGRSGKLARLPARRRQTQQQPTRDGRHHRA